MREIEDLFAEGRPSWDVLSAKLASARPFQLPSANFAIILETGQSLARIDNAKILQSFARDHANPVVGELLDSHAIGQIAKIPGGNLKVYVTSEEHCHKLAHQEVTILGNRYSFREYDILGSKYFLDVFGVNPGTECGRLARALHELGCDIIYDNFREAIAGKAITMSTWRVYFRSATCPTALVVEGKVCEQLDIDGRLFLARGKSAPLPVERLRFGQRSAYCLRYSSKNNIPNTKAQSAASKPSVKTVSSATQPSINKRMPVRTPSTDKTSPSAAASTVTTEENKRDEATATITKNQSAVAPTSAEALSSLASPVQEVAEENQQNTRRESDDLSLAALSNVDIFPPSSPPRVRNAPMDPIPTHPWMTVQSRNKRNRKVNVFTNLINRARPQPLDGLVTSNYFAVLQSVEVEFAKVDVTASAESGWRYQIIPASVKTNADTLASKEAAHLFKKKHTSIVKGERPVTVGEVIQSMREDVKLSDTLIRPDKLFQADSYGRTVGKLISQSTNADKVLQFASAQPIAFHGALLRGMKENSEDLTQLIHLHTINRVMSASEPNSDTAFSTKWTKYIGGKVPSNRVDLFSKTNSWWSNSPELAQSLKATQALAFFELMLLTTAPMIFKNDHWSHYITGQPAVWIPAHHCRLLHPNTLLLLLRSYVGALCLSEWVDLGWKNEIYDHLEEFQLSNSFYCEEVAVLQLTSDTEVVKLIAGPLNVQY